MKRISSPIESRLEDNNGSTPIESADYLVVGSGYGGAVAAMRLSGASAGSKPAKVVLLERGKEYLPGDFPYDVEDLPAHVRLVQGAREADTGTGGYADALFNLHVGATPPRRHGDAQDEAAGRAAVDILVGSGLGGTSLINANVAEEAADHVFQQPEWPHAIRTVDKPLQQAYQAVREQLNLTQRSERDGQPFGKYSALQRIAAAAGSEVRPAHIAVNDTHGENPQGVTQPACNDCGNCITGCNTGAKNTLDRNLLRQARSNGALLYTGATVLYVEPANNSHRRWRVWLRPTVKIERAQSCHEGTPNQRLLAKRHGQLYYIDADNVILAAGTLGSTQILQRSRARARLPLSARLGEQFSSNGDGIAFTYAQDTEVNAVASPDSPVPANPVGPTITGIVQTQGLTIEDATVPAALSEVFRELTTTGAMLQRLTKRRLPDLIRSSGQDPLAASSSVARHCQALLVMGDDGATGRIHYSEEHDSTSVEFPDVGESRSLVSADALFSDMDRGAGFDGGQYVPNPLWQLMPGGAADALSGALPDARALTVHPLGGCAMGDSVGTGVVNHAGQVFDANGYLHDGLYVFDGAIIPRALGVNPFLTIAALAWRNCDLLLGSSEFRNQPMRPEFASLGAVPLRQRTEKRPVRFQIQEQMLGQLRDVPDYLLLRHNAANRNGDKPQVARRLKQRDGLVVNVDARSADAEAWLENPGVQPLQARMRLYVNPLNADTVRDFQPEGIRSSSIDEDQHLLCELDGTFTVLAEDKSTQLRDWWGGAVAFFTFLHRRGIRGLTSTVAAGSRLAWLKSLAAKAPVFFKIGMMQGRRRRIRYDFRSRDGRLHVYGDKVLSYRCSVPRLWPGLMNLPVNIRQDNYHPERTTLRVNSEQLLNPGLLEIRDSTHLPQSLLFAGGLAAFFARNLFTTNFWELGGAEVPPQPHQPRTTPRALNTDSGAIAPRMTPLDVPLRQETSEHKAGTVQLLLTNYRNPGAPPVLMLHGLAQGSQIFWTDSIEHNLANHFYNAGFDVWLLDYRLSNHILPGMQDQDWSIDEIAKFDIPYALRAVCENTGRQQTAVVAHCVGACALAMAALADNTVGDRIAAAVTNAIHPWVIGSSGNKFRAKLGGMYREWVPQALLNPIPGKDDTALQNVMDRLGYGLSRLEEAPPDNHRHYDDDPVCDSICDRMTFLYGRMWNHSNLARETHNAFKDMLGPAPIGVYQHLYHFNNEQRVTDRNGENVYLKRRQIQHNWTFPILFVHGGDSRVFNPHAARRSARKLKRLLHNRPGYSSPAVDYQIYEGYGHMDVIFGKDAYRKCFDDYVRFIQTARPISQNVPRDWQAANEKQLVTGPILRAAWHENGKVRLRYWGELRRSKALAPRAMTVAGATLLDEFGIEHTTKSRRKTRRFRLMDVEIDPGHNHVDLVIAAQGLGPDRGHTLHYHAHRWLADLRQAQPVEDRVSFLLGSCRYPGSLVDNRLSDKVYGAMLEHTNSADGVNFAFFTGDQIYADATDQILEVKSPKTRYTDRYRTAFGRSTSPNFARLVRQVPTHFSLDDHELTDNWSGYLRTPTSAPEGTNRHALRTAMHYMGGGRSQRPLTRTGPTLNSGRHPFHYALASDKECHFPIYIADTRAERQPRTTGGVASFSLFSHEQLSAIKAWLLRANRGKHKARPKFIVSGSIIAPLTQQYCANRSTWRAQDGWAGYPETLETLLHFIVEENISRVVFVGGDAHLSAVAELRITSGTQTGKVWQIVGSGLYAPLPFANSLKEHFLWNESHSLPTHTQRLSGIECRNTFLSDAYSQFVRVDAQPGSLVVTSHDADNTLLASHTVDFSGD